VPTPFSRRLSACAEGCGAATHRHWLHPGMPSGAYAVFTATLSLRGGLRDLKGGAAATHRRWLHPGMPSGVYAVFTATLSLRGGLRTGEAALQPRIGTGCIRGCRQVPTPFSRRLSACAEGCGARCVFCVFLDLRERARGAGYGALSRILHSPLSVSRGARARGHGPTEIAARREHIAVDGAREVLGGET
jgi:hypothetical protein